MTSKSTAKQGTELALLTPKQLKSQQEQLQIIDVRSWLEYLIGHIPEAQHLSRSRILKEIPKNQAMVVVCLSGHRSLPVAQWLIKQGYQKVYNLQGGLMAWKSNGYALRIGNQP
jgi:rhodanese-related sulfurtransferase